MISVNLSVSANVCAQSNVYLSILYTYSAEKQPKYCAIITKFLIKNLSVA